MRVSQERSHGFFVAGSVVTHFAAFADALIWLDMRAGRDFLQV
jgi:hypothetical protein